MVKPLFKRIAAYQFGFDKYTMKSRFVKPGMPRRVKKNADSGMALRLLRSSHPAESSPGARSMSLIATRKMYFVENRSRKIRKTVTPFMNSEDARYRRGW